MTQPFRFHARHRDSRWLVTCDHASNGVPPEISGGDLGIAAADMARHIAFDLGAAGLAATLADALAAPAILSDFSRLVIDPNRGEDDPTLLMRLYDGTVIPANRHADAAERERRLALYHRPYHAAIAGHLALRDDAVLCAVHSFTPRLRGRPPRPWQVGILSAWDRRLADPLIDWLRAHPPVDPLLAEMLARERWCVGDNEPYSGHLPGDSVDRHALRHGRLNVLLELRSDLIDTAPARKAWADYISLGLRVALAQAPN